MDETEINEKNLPYVVFVELTMREGEIYETEKIVAQLRRYLETQGVNEEALHPQLQPVLTAVLAKPTHNPDELRYHIMQALFRFQKTGQLLQVGVALVHAKLLLHELKRNLEDSDGE